MLSKVIDSTFIPHGNWSGLSYGQLTVLFITYVLHSLTHRFSGGGILGQSAQNGYRTCDRLASREIRMPRTTGWAGCRKFWVKATKTQQNFSFGWDKASSVRINCRHKASGMTPRVSMCIIARTTRKTVFWNSATAKITGRIFCNSNKAWRHWIRPEFHC